MAVFWFVAPCTWNVGKLLPDYTAQQPRRQPPSYSPPWEFVIYDDLSSLIRWDFRFSRRRIWKWLVVYHRQFSFLMNNQWNSVCVCVCVYEYIGLYFLSMCRGTFWDLLIIFYMCRTLCMYSINWLAIHYHFVGHTIMWRSRGTPIFPCRQICRSVYVLCTFITVYIKSSLYLSWDSWIYHTQFL
jgi:hypothetical protein